MATSRVLIDTSIIIEHLRKQNQQKSILYTIVDTNYNLCLLRSFSSVHPSKFITNPA
jgi:hypothetical protein